MPESTTVTVRYWAGARAAAGVDAESQSGETLGAVLAAATAAHPDLERVVAVSTFLVDGRASDRDRAMSAGMTIEVLPPFAGG
jgi:molybdopterin converting factor small subunit